MSDDPLLAYTRKLTVGFVLRSLADLAELVAYGLLFWADWRVGLAVCLFQWANNLRGKAQ